MRARVFHFNSSAILSTFFGVFERWSLCNRIIIKRNGKQECNKWSFHVRNEMILSSYRKTNSIFLFCFIVSLTNSFVLAYRVAFVLRTEAINMNAITIELSVSRYCWNKEPEKHFLFNFSKHFSLVFLCLSKSVYFDGTKSKNKGEINQM